ncbi:MAG TPA: hypothetical protein VNM91_03810 [Dehalococcoidia bacterium]|nr:hypothetical protein [Dehalococcoidia bacterium]
MIWDSIYHELRQWLEFAYAEGILERTGWCEHGYSGPHRACQGPFNRPEPYGQKLEAIIAWFEAQTGDDS